MEHRDFLEHALEEALKAKQEGEDPIGCVIVDENGEIIARERNHINNLNDPTAHAEMLAIRSAVSRMRDDAARGWTLYSTLEPCPMCLGTIVMCHIGTMVWAANDRRKGTHRLLSANAYMRSRKVLTVGSPYADLGTKCWQLHEAYWIAKGRPEMVRAIDDDAG